MLLDTAVGPIDASRLATQVMFTETAAGQLKTTTYFLGDAVVKIDQRLEISEAALEAAGLSQL